MADEALNARILAWFKEKSQGERKKFYIQDVFKGLVDVSKGEIKKAVAEMTTEGTLKYWSSGSTTLLTLPEFFDAP
jgi:hypothetical protein